MITPQARKKRPAVSSLADEEEEEEVQFTDEEEIPEEDSDDDDEHAGLPTPGSASKKPRLMAQHNYGASTFGFPTVSAADPEVRVKSEREEMEGRYGPTAAKAVKQQKQQLRIDGPFLPLPVSWFERSLETAGTASAAAAAAAAGGDAVAAPVQPAVYVPTQPWPTALDSTLCVAVAVACQKTAMGGTPWMVITAIPWVMISQGICAGLQGAARPAQALSPQQCQSRFMQLLKVFYVQEKTVPAELLSGDLRQRLRLIVQQNSKEEGGMATQR